MRLRISERKTQGKGKEEEGIGTACGRGRRDEEARKIREGGNEGMSNNMMGKNRESREQSE